jgi:hypothetical protein
MRRLVYLFSVGNIPDLEYLLHTSWTTYTKTLPSIAAANAIVNRFARHERRLAGLPA